jgi:hypothetical protein
MNTPFNPINCPDETTVITIHLPCRLAERVERYANEIGETFSSVMIEALDTFMRSEKLDLYGW